MEHSIKNEIIDEIILPYYKNNIKYTIENSNRWSIIYNICVILSQILCITASVLSFSNSQYPKYNLSFVSGILSLLSMKLTYLSYIISKYNHVKTLHTNDLIKKLNIDLEIEDDSMDGLIKDIESNDKNI